MKARFVVAGWSLTVRRLHDLGYSGWWFLPMILIESFCLHILTEIEFPTTYFLVLIPYLVFNTTFAVLFSFKKGKKGKNRYGLPPVEDQ